MSATPDPPPAGDAATGATTPAGSVETGTTTPAGSVAPIVARVWELRRRAEKQSRWGPPVLGVFFALGFIVIANPDLLPGGFTTTLTGLAVIIAVAIIAGIVSARRTSVRGHSGNVSGPESQGRRWWRNPALASPAMFSVVFLGNLIDLFDRWPVILATAAVVGCLAALSLPRYETADHIHGTRLEHVPGLSAAGEAAVAEAALTPGVLELLVLQHHTSERRISWCADVLGTDADDIRSRISRGRRWLELPATEVHDPATAEWVRLTSAGREALGYI